jgi:hypothetical protein
MSIDRQADNLLNPKPWSKRAALTARKTYSSDSAIIYKRKKHVMTLKDVSRMQEAVQSDDADDAEFTWWQKILNWLAEYMVGKLTGLLSLDEGVGQIVWNAANYFWQKLIKQIGGTNYFLEQSISAYQGALESALKAYLEGDQTLLEALAADLLNLGND